MTTGGRLTEKSTFSTTETISVPLTEDFVSNNVNHAYNNNNNKNINKTHKKSIILFTVAFRRAFFTLSPVVTKPVEIFHEFHCKL